MNKRILWIDDDVNNPELQTEKFELEKNDFIVVGSETPDAGLEVLKTDTDFGCIIVDISMPRGKNISFAEARGGMRTGLIILRRLLADTRLNNIKKIVYTVIDDGEIIKECENQNVLYIKKGCLLSSEFLECIKTKLVEDEK